MVHKSQVKLSEVQQTIIDQLKALNRLFVIDYGVKKIIAFPDGIRLYIGGRKVTNVDIKYDYGADLYNLEFHKLSHKTFETKTEKIKGVYVDQLDDIIRSKL